jgi:predicted ester cyclase
MVKMMETLNAIEIAARNKTNYLRAKEAFNADKIDECMLYYAPEHQIKSKPGEAGRDNGIKPFLAQIRETWADIQITVEHIVAEDDWVMARSRATATHTKVVLGVSPTNKKIEAIFWDLHRFNDEGLIIETWNMMDNLAIMRQLGLLPA